MKLVQESKEEELGGNMFGQIKKDKEAFEPFEVVSIQFGKKNFKEMELLS